MCKPAQLNRNHIQFRPKTWVKVMCWVIPLIVSHMLFCTTYFFSNGGYLILKWHSSFLWYDVVTWYWCGHMCSLQSRGAELIMNTFSNLILHTVRKWGPISAIQYNPIISALRFNHWLTFCNLYFEICKKKWPIGTRRVFWKENLF